MNKKYFDIIMYTNAKKLGTECGNYVHRLPFIEGISKAMKGIGKVLVVFQPRSIPQCWFDGDEKIREATAETAILKQLSENLWATRPIVTGNLVLASYFPFFRWIIRRQVANHIKQIFSSLNMTNQRVAWMTHPYHYLYRGCIRESVLLYECYDEHTFTSSGNGNKKTGLLELELARNAELNITTAKPLYDKLSAVNSKTMLVSNGVMYDMFSQCRDSQMPVAPELRRLPSPVIGMIGNLYRGYDFRLLDDIIRRKTGWSFVFVGEVSENARKDVDNLSKHSNFHVFSWRPYYEVLPFIKGFDVAIIPYKVNDWTNTINPNKVYEYFAAGIPVVATPIVELQRHNKCIALCQRSGDFIIAIEKAVRGELEDKVQIGIHLAKNMSWDSITKEIVRELAESI